MEIKKRKKYTVKNLMTDLKKIEPIPSVLYRVGKELVYTEWNLLRQIDADDTVAQHMKELLDFTQGQYEQMLLEGELCKTSDTPKKALNVFIRDRPKEFLIHDISRMPDYVYGLLKSLVKAQKTERKKFKAIEKGLRKQLKDTPENPDLWNQLRLVLWILGKYKDASEAYRKATSYGWNPESSSLVAVF